MRHKVKKIKVKFGKDANKMLMRKLLKNFLKEGKIITTNTKAKLLKSFIDRIVFRVREDNEKNRRYIMKHIGNDKKLINFLFKNVGETFKDIIGGYVKVKRLIERSSDGSLMVQVNWSKPVLLDNDKKEKNKIVSTKKK